LVIHGNAATLQRSTDVGTPLFRIFRINLNPFGGDNGANVTDVTISGLTIRNGSATGGFLAHGRRHL
jgi:hypothetical protein